MAWWMIASRLTNQLPAWLIYVGLQPMCVRLQLECMGLQVGCMLYRLVLEV